MQRGDESQTLEHAFETFNSLSVQLAESYQALEKRVLTLSEALQQAHSERLKQLAEKERLANRLSQLLELLPGGVVVLDGVGSITDCNPAALRLLGNPLLQCQWDEVTQRAFEPNSDDCNEACLKNGKRVNITTQVLGTEPGKIVLLMDVTEQYALQSILNRHCRLSALGDMAASLAHQIRTPLATTLLYMSHLTRVEVSDEDRLRILDKVFSRLRFLDHLVNDMLRFAKSGSFEMDCITVDSLLKEVAQSIEPQLNAVDGELVVTGHSKAALIRGNRDALHGAMLNLLTNAIQAKGQNVKIIINVLWSVRGKIRIEIRDNGPGIDPEVFGKLFTPFFTTKADGTGLGLAVVQAIIEAHHGSITAVSGVKQGAAFVLELLQAEESVVIKKALRHAKSLR